MEKYYVIENRNIGIIGRPEMQETVLFSGTLSECTKFEDERRKLYKNRTVVDCYVQSETERNKAKQINDFWNSLSDDEKKEDIIVNGKKYNKALYNFHKGSTNESLNSEKNPKIHGNSRAVKEHER